MSQQYTGNFVLNSFTNMSVVWDNQLLAVITYSKPSGWAVTDPMYRLMYYILRATSNSTSLTFISNTAGSKGM